jgi:hypothetical protein
LERLIAHLDAAIDPYRPDFITKVELGSEVVSERTG